MGIPCKDHRPRPDEFAHIPFEGPCPDCEIEALKKEAATLVAHSNNVVLQARNHASRANEAEARVAELEGVVDSCRLHICSGDSYDQEVHDRLMRRIYSALRIPNSPDNAAPRAPSTEEE